MPAFSQSLDQSVRRALALAGASHGPGPPKSASALVQPGTGGVGLTTLTYAKGRQHARPGNPDVPGRLTLSGERMGFLLIPVQVFIR